MSEKCPILIAGPTASGKSALALDLARDRTICPKATIVNADSMQVHAGLRVLTARPSAADEAVAPHRLYGIVPGGASFSAGTWLAAAGRELEDARRQGRRAILVGGTGLYFHCLTEGLADIPDIPEPVRRRWRQALQRDGAGALRSELAARDPEMASRPDAGDPQRLVRALEVIEATGVSLADWQRRPSSPPLLPPEACRRIVLAPPRGEVYARIDARVERMIEAGALAEVEGLLALNLPPDVPVMKAIGVAELAAVLEGRQSLDEAMRTIRTRTRRYAKRQLTWFRNRMADWTWIEDRQELLRLFESPN